MLLAAPGPGARLRDRGVAAWAALPQTAAAMEPVRQDWEELGWPRVVEAWTTRCASARGVALITDRVLCSTLDEARARAAEVSEARRLASLGSPLPLGGIDDIASAIERVRKAAALDAPELRAVAGTARAMARLRQHLAGHVDEVPRLAALGAGLADLGHVYHPILEAFDAEGRLVDHASDALGPLRRALAAIKGQLERRMKAMLEDDLYAPYLQDAYYTQREDRYVLPVRHDGKGFIKGIVHGTSGSGQTLFIEPDEIVDLNNRMKLAECDVLDEERRILARFSGWVAEEADAFDRSLAIAAHLDLVGAAGRLADDLVAAEPILDEAPRLALLHARHPLMLLAGRRCVANDLALGAGQTLVVSGPNAGGKTVALKAAGLAALMARAGLHVAAESGSVVGWFTDVRTDIGDAQSLEQNLSTFTGHVKRLGEFLAEAGPGTLLLVDEIAVGTDPEQGAALAQAVLEALAARGLTAIVTTHYDRLKALAATDARFANASVGYDLSRLEPTFKLHLGVPGSSGALTVARRAGLTGAIVDRAQELLGPAGARVDDLLANVAEQRRRLEEERAAVLAELEALEADRAGLLAARDRVVGRYDRQARAAHGETLATLKQARRELDDARAELRRREVLDKPAVQAVGKRIAVAAAQVARAEPARPPVPGQPARPDQLVPGVFVVVPRLGRGEVASAAERGKVDLRFGALRATVDVADVLLDSHRAAQRAARTAEPGPRGGRREVPTAPPVVLVDGQGDGRATARTPDATLDVRGQRADEAEAALERFIDESLLAGRDLMFVIHGHGTGALRQAVRARLAAMPTIERWRAGEKSEGGDGITVAFLK